ncbi:unnamed protein product [Caenorhabditis bovis]|uniref:Activin types I and II receptor domain-containing protein n=1 Tax=Caenorhabditis bovis TaxID=2654633 RepID=A0A8S1ED12_9PELO|nr:unnamed protein product [Caenorhabditis bovis]
MNVGRLLQIIFLGVLIRESFGMWCFDGSDCEATDTCALCDGAACLRVQRNHPQRGLSVAMTCLPHDSLIHTYHPEGCRTELGSGEKLCLCSNRDFCNSSPTRFLLYIFFLVLLLM